MEGIRIPQHVIQRLERRWTARFGRMCEQHPLSHLRTVEQDDPLRSPYVGRLLVGSLRPPSRGDDATCTLQRSEGRRGNLNFSFRLSIKFYRSCLSSVERRDEETRNLPKASAHQS